MQDLTAPELAAVLAGLRLLQSRLLSVTIDSDQLTDILTDTHEIHQDQVITTEQIDKLAERLNTAAKLNRVLIEVEGGNVQNVYADDSAITVLMLDRDNAKSDEDDEKTATELSPLIDELTQVY